MAKSSRFQNVSERTRTERRGGTCTTMTIDYHTGGRETQIKLEDRRKGRVRVGKAGYADNPY